MVINAVNSGVHLRMLVGLAIVKSSPLVYLIETFVLCNYFVHIYVRDSIAFFVYHSNVVITMYTAPIHDTFLLVLTLMMFLT